MRKIGKKAGFSPLATAPIRVSDQFRRTFFLLRQEQGEFRLIERPALRRNGFSDFFQNADPMLAEGQVIRLVRQGDGDVQPSVPDAFGARQNIVAAGAGDALLAEEGYLLGPLNPRNEGLDVLSR